MTHISQSGDGKQATTDGAGVIERAIKPVSSPSEFLGGDVGNKGIARRTANTFPDPIQTA